MRVLAVAQKSLRQQSRDRLGLALTVLIAPLFVVLYWALFADRSEPPTACLHLDPGVVADVVHVAQGRVRFTSCPDRDAMLTVRAPALADAASTTDPIRITIDGDATQPNFAAAVQTTQLALDRYALQLRGKAPATEVVVQASGRSDSQSPFDLYVPNLLIFALIMLVFSSAMAIAREVERGTLERLRLTQMRPTDYLAGMAIAQALLGAVSICITLIVAMLLGFEARPSALPLAALVAVMTGIACVGVGTIVASMSRSVAQAFAVSSFFMFLLLLFSGVVFPIPSLALLDALPTVHGARALHDVLVLDASFGDIARRLGALAVLSAVFFGVGGWRFAHLHRTFVHEVR